MPRGVKALHIEPGTRRRHGRLKGKLQENDTGAVTLGSSNIAPPTATTSWWLDAFSLNVGQLSKSGSDTL